MVQKLVLLALGLSNALFWPEGMGGIDRLWRACTEKYVFSGSVLCSAVGGDANLSIDWFWRMRARGE